MSYARWSEGDVYVWGTSKGEYVCMLCSLQTKSADPEVWPDDFDCKTAQAMHAHLRQHEDAGDCIPSRAFALLEADIAASAR